MSLLLLLQGYLMIRLHRPVMMQDCKHKSDVSDINKPISNLTDKQYQFAVNEQAVQAAQSQQRARHGQLSITHSAPPPALRAPAAH